MSFVRIIKDNLGTLFKLVRTSSGRRGFAFISADNVAGYKLLFPRSSKTTVLDYQVNLRNALSKLGMKTVRVDKEHVYLHVMFDAPAFDPLPVPVLEPDAPVTMEEGPEDPEDIDDTTDTTGSDTELETEPLSESCRESCYTVSGAYRMQQIARQARQAAFQQQLQLIRERNKARQALETVEYKQKQRDELRKMAMDPWMGQDICRQAHNKLLML